ncbi:DUF1097 domain-containing protein [Nocardia vinacea]|uniref:DUF1097 domain-containing protein n=1 Tax=Nocardia vinacea TaxID=96468 RepID=UPI002E10B5B4|nr:DUF1097 domain-containing protein [Nocardia vinacea]
MRQLDALSISIGVLGGTATLITATVLTVPVWVIFIAWASFFILGAGTAGLKKSIASNLVGIAIASLTLLAIHALGGGTAVAAIAVGVGSAAMVQASKIELLSKLPAIVWGFASTVGTVAATGYGITTASISNPALVTALAMVLGALFGIASEYWGAAMTAHPASGPVAEVLPEGQ